MSALELRPYQQDLVDRVRASYQGGARSVCMQAATGSGKTRMAAEILRSSVALGFRAVFAAHLDSLIEDTHDRLTAAGIDAGFVQADRPTNPTAPVQVCSLATLHRRGERPPADLVILDECHRAAAATVRQVLAGYPSSHLLGLTATPQRGDGQPLGSVFQALVCGPSVKDLTRDGHLVPCEVVAPPTVEERGLACDPVEAYEKWAPGSRAIVFASTVEHAEDLVHRFSEAGCPAVLFVGETPRKERQAARAGLALGAVKVIVSCNALVEGFDAPSVETVILARAFTVTGSFLQAIGRGLRPSKDTGKSRCVVLDLRGAVNLHGLPDEDRRWSLDGKAVVRTEPLKALAHCRACLAIFRPSRECPRCGAEREVQARVTRTLNRAEKLERLSHLTQEQRDARYLKQLRWVAGVRLRLEGAAAERWARRAFERRFGREPEVAA